MRLFRGRPKPVEKQNDGDSAGTQHVWLTRADQTILAIASTVLLAALASLWFARGGHRGKLIEIDRAVPLDPQFQVDVNSATWPELAQLPNIGQVLAQRIVESRQRDGPFQDHQDLRRVSGIGPRTLEGMQPYLLPLPERTQFAGN